MWESGINTNALLYALTGFEPTAYEKRAKFTPHLPEEWKFFTMKNFRVGDTHLSYRGERRGTGVSYTIAHNSGNSLMIKIHLTKQVLSEPKLNGKRIETSWKKNRFGVLTSDIEFPLSQGETILIQI